MEVSIKELFDKYTEALEEMNRQNSRVAAACQCWANGVIGDSDLRQYSARQREVELEFYVAERNYRHASVDAVRTSVT